MLNVAKAAANFLKIFSKLQNIQLDNLVDFEKCCKTPIYLQRSAPIQPKTSEILPNICQKLATTLRVARLRPAGGTAVRRCTADDQAFGLFANLPRLRLFVFCASSVSRCSAWLLRFSHAFWCSAWCSRDLAQVERVNFQPPAPSATCSDRFSSDDYSRRGK